MRFRGLDLNLLVAFDTLMETHSAARTAERMNLSQAAVSAALSRLRLFFEDELFLVHGRRLHPTAFAESLIPAVRECLRSADKVVRTSGRFDPALSNREFKVMASDYGITAYFAPLLRRLSSDAPHVRVTFLPIEEQSGVYLDRGLIDLVLLGSDYATPTHPSEVLHEDEQVVIGCASNAIFDGAISLDAYLAASHVALAIPGPEFVFSFADKWVSKLGHHRRIDVVAQSFTVLPFLVMGTPRLSLVHRRLAETVFRGSPIRHARPPMPIPPMRMVMQFRATHADDEGLAWLRTQLRASVDET